MFLSPLTSVSSADNLDVYVLLSMKVVELSAAPTVPQEAVALSGPSPSPLSYGNRATTGYLSAMKPSLLVDEGEGRPTPIRDKKVMARAA